MKSSRRFLILSAAGLFCWSCAGVTGATPSEMRANGPATEAGAVVLSPGTVETPDVGVKANWVIAIHGGAGVKMPPEMTPALEAEYRRTLGAALEAGAVVLEGGGDGPAAIVAALTVLEDSPIFNAGRGAALDATGQARHDASIMRGDTLDAGGVAGSMHIKNPIAAARAVMEQTENVLLHGAGADWFAQQQGLALAEPIYFQTEERRRLLLEKRAETPALEERAAAPVLEERSRTRVLEERARTPVLEERARTPDTAAVRHDAETSFGTVGAVVLDSHGVISAGTSTGGRTNKRFGRIGDSPIIGAGTYASNTSCAVSATGHGEFFMRWTAARNICARVEYGGETLAAAAGSVVNDTLKHAGGRGAVIAIDPSGNVVFAMNDTGMYRGVMSSETPARTAIYADETVR